MKTRSKSPAPFFLGITPFKSLLQTAKSGCQQYARDAKQTAPHDNGKNNTDGGKPHMVIPPRGDRNVTPPLACNTMIKTHKGSMPAWVSMAKMIKAQG